MQLPTANIRKPWVEGWDHGWSHATSILGFRPLPGQRGPSSFITRYRDLHFALNFLTKSTMAIGEGVTEIPDSEDESMTSSPDTFSVAVADADKPCKPCLAAREPIQDSQAAPQAARALAGSTRQQTSARHDCLVSSQKKASNDDPAPLADGQNHNQTQANAISPNSKREESVASSDINAAAIEHEMPPKPSPRCIDLTPSNNVDSAPQKSEIEISAPSGSVISKQNTDRGKEIRTTEKTGPALNSAHTECSDVEAAPNVEMVPAQEPPQHTPLEILETKTQNKAPNQEHIPFQETAVPQSEAEKANKTSPSPHTNLPSENAQSAAPKSATSGKVELGDAGIEDGENGPEKSVPTLEHKDYGESLNNSHITHKSTITATLIEPHYDNSAVAEPVESPSFESHPRHGSRQPLTNMAEPSKPSEDSTSSLESRLQDTGMRNEHIALQVMRTSEERKQSSRPVSSLPTEAATPVTGAQDRREKPEIENPIPFSNESGSIQQQNSPEKTPQEKTLAELRAQKAALISSLATLPRLQELMMEARGPDAKGEPMDDDIMDAANKIVKEHIKLLHEYNEMKDAGQGLMGLIADQRGVRIVEVQDEFGIDAKD